MFQHFLLATDGSPLSSLAVSYGTRLAKRLGARVTIVTVIEPFCRTTLEIESLKEAPTAYEVQADQHAARALASASAIVGGLGVPHQAITIENAEPAAGITRAAIEQECDLIVMGSHGRRGLSALILGSEARDVLTHSEIPVLVYREPATPDASSRILVTDRQAACQQS